MDCILRRPSGIWEVRGLERAKAGSGAGRDAVVVSKVPGRGGPVVREVFRTPRTACAKA